MSGRGSFDRSELMQDTDLDSASKKAHWSEGILRSDSDPWNALCMRPFQKELNKNPWSGDQEPNSNSLVGKSVNHSTTVVACMLLIH
jgi:hypothetical protein